MKHTLILLFTLSLLLTLSSCGREAEVGNILDAMCGAHSALPAGRVYLSEAEAGEAGYADDELLAVLFGDGALPMEFDCVNGFAMRLSAVGTPHEYIVLCCVSPQDAYDAARMCLRRADLLRRAYIETEWAGMADGAHVCAVGRYVLMAVGEDPLSAIEAGRRAIGGR